jgi:hypothetical protein
MDLNGCGHELALRRASPPAPPAFSRLMTTSTAVSAESFASAREKLDAHTVEMVAWHFHDSTGCPFWLEKKSQLKFDPLKDIKCFEDLKKWTGTALGAERSGR